MEVYSSWSNTFPVSSARWCDSIRMFFSKLISNSSMETTNMSYRKFKFSCVVTLTWLILFEAFIWMWLDGGQIYFFTFYTRLGDKHTQHLMYNRGNTTISSLSKMPLTLLWRCRHYQNCCMESWQNKLSSFLSHFMFYAYWGSAGSSNCWNSLSKVNTAVSWWECNWNAALY